MVIKLSKLPSVLSRGLESTQILISGFHQKIVNSTYVMLESEEILAVGYEDGEWHKPYYDCGGGNIWMMTYTVPFFGYNHQSKQYYFK